MIVKQIIDFHKAAFDNAFDTITTFLYYSEKVTRFFGEKAHLFSPEGEKVITEWMEVYKKSRKDFKESVDDSFNAIEHYFVDMADATGFFVSTLVENTNQSVKEVADKSIQTEAIVTDTTVKQSTIAEKMAVEGNSDTGLAKTVRKSVKQLKK